MSGQSNNLNWWHDCQEEDKKNDSHGETNKDAVAVEASAPSSGNGIGNANGRRQMERNDNEPERRQRDGGGGWDDWKNYNGKWEKDAAGYWHKVDGDDAGGAPANDRPDADANEDGGWGGNWGNGNGGGYGKNNRCDDYKKDKKDRAWPENGLSDAENAYARSLTRTLRHAKEGGKDAAEIMDARGFVESVNLREFEGAPPTKELLEKVTKFDTKHDKPRFEVYAHESSGRVWIRALGKQTVTHLVENWWELKKPTELDHDATPATAATAASETSGGGGFGAATTKREEKDEHNYNGGKSDGLEADHFNGKGPRYGKDSSCYGYAKKGDGGGKAAGKKENDKQDSSHDSQMNSGDGKNKGHGDNSNRGYAGNKGNDVDYKGESWGKKGDSGKDGKDSCKGKGKDGFYGDDAGKAKGASDDKGKKGGHCDDDGKGKNRGQGKGGFSAEEQDHGKGKNGDKGNKNGYSYADEDGKGIGKGKDGKDAQEGTKDGKGKSGNDGKGNVKDGKAKDSGKGGKEDGKGKDNTYHGGKGKSSAAPAASHLTVQDILCIDVKRVASEVLSKAKSLQMLDKNLPSPPTICPTEQDDPFKWSHGVRFEVFQEAPDELKATTITDVRKLWNHNCSVLAMHANGYVYYLAKVEATAHAHVLTFVRQDPKGDEVNVWQTSAIPSLPI